ncbi:hypothetical protein [Actinophytocola glycyrrhizae]|uniref:Uncharacterized protein n=1 Tax=Actinophytocola glycyrrhizae TaxID=2044873 RepID=A0ABV9RXJ6_9PSEU
MKDATSAHDREKTMFRKATLAVLTTLVTTLPAHAQEQDPTEIWPNQVSRRSGRCRGPRHRSPAAADQTSVSDSGLNKGVRNVAASSPDMNSCSRDTLRRT